MILTQEEHYDFLNTILDEQINNALKSSEKKDRGFCWEGFWTKTIEDSITSFYTNKINSFLKNISQGQEKTSVSHFVLLSEENKKHISEYRDSFYEKNNIKPVLFEEKLPEICLFFKTHRNIDFNSMSKEKKEERLNEEAIIMGKITIYDFLNITYMQYLHLTLNKSVLL